MNMQKVPFKQIRASKDFNVRLTYELEGESGIKALADDIKRQGQLNPLIVKVADSGKGYDLIAGFRRYKALELNGAPDALVQVFEGSEEDAYFLNLTENTARSELTPYEIAARCTQIRDMSVKWSKDKQPMTAAQIGNRVAGLSNKYVSNLMRCFDRLHPEFLKAWRDGHGLCTTDKLTKIASEDDKDAQLELKIFSVGDGMKCWREILSGEADSGGEGEEGEGKEGEGKGKDVKATRRATEKSIVAAMESIKASEDVDKETKRTLVMALEFALGHRATLPGYKPAKDVKKGKLKNGEQATA